MLGVISPVIIRSESADRSFLCLGLGLAFALGQRRDVEQHLGFALVLVVQIDIQTTAIDQAAKQQPFDARPLQMAV